jgi:hypothetical protein
VAQQFYFGSLLMTGLVMWTLWWYMSSGRRLVDPDLSPRAIRRHHLISSGVPASVLLLMVLVAFGYVVLGVLEGWKSLPAVLEEPVGSGDAGPQDEGVSKGPSHASG